MQIYKERDFGALINDTFNFFRTYGKNYFKLYLTLNGAMLLVILLLGALMFYGINMLGTNSEAGIFSAIDTYTSNNGFMIFIFALIGFVVFFLLCVVVYNFPIFYLKRIGDSQIDITTDDILNDLKNNIWKFLKFSILSTFIVIPIFFFMMMISSFLMIILIGFVLLLILMPAFYVVINFTLYHYMSTDSSYFSSLSYAMRIVFAEMFNTRTSKFWKYWASTIVLGLVIYIVNLAFTLIPYFMLVGGELFNPNYDETASLANPFSKFYSILMFVLYGISLLINLLTYNIMSINAGLMYYDSRADIHKKNNFSEIDTIGQADA